MKDRILCYTFLVNFQCADLIAMSTRKKKNTLTYITREIMNYYSESKLVVLICIERLIFTKCFILIHAKMIKNYQNMLMNFYCKYIVALDSVGLL
jgi:hypothetical protein